MAILRLFGLYFLMTLLMVIVGSIFGAYFAGNFIGGAFFFLIFSLPIYPDIKNNEIKNNRVTIKNMDNGMKMTYAIVSESEADLAAKKISVTSPIGKGLLGKAIGDIAKIETPNGSIHFEIMDIQPF